MPNPTQHADVFAALAAPFAPEEEKILEVNGRPPLTYVTARTVMNRLDNVLGPENWEDDYEVLREVGLVCQLTITLPDGREVTKAGVGVVSNNGGDAEKGGESDALKRAAVKFGVGRYLYNDDIPIFARESLGEAAPAAPQRRAAPAGNRSQGNRTPQRQQAPAGNQGSGQQGGSRQYPPADPLNPPSDGKKFFFWVRELYQQEGIEKVQNYGKDAFGGKRIYDYTPDEIAETLQNALDFQDDIPF